MFVKSAVQKPGVEYGFEEFSSAIENFEKNYAVDIDRKFFFGFPLDAVLKAEKKLISPESHSIAYFSMEYGIAPSIYNSFTLSRPMSEKNRFFKHEVFSNYWICDYIFKIEINKMLDIPIYG